MRPSTIPYDNQFVAFVTAFVVFIYATEILIIFCFSSFRFLFHWNCVLSRFLSVSSCFAVSFHYLFSLVWEYWLYYFFDCLEIFYNIVSFFCCCCLCVVFVALHVQCNWFVHSINDKNQASILNRESNLLVTSKIKLKVIVLAVIILRAKLLVSHNF